MRVSQALPIIICRRQKTISNLVLLGFLSGEALILARDTWLLGGYVKSVVVFSIATLVSLGGHAQMLGSKNRGIGANEGRSMTVDALVKIRQNACEALAEKKKGLIKTIMTESSLDELMRDVMAHDIRLHVGRGSASGKIAYRLQVLVDEKGIVAQIFCK